MDTLEIPVTYKNEELSLKAHVVRFGYVNHLIVDLRGTKITIERDEEGNYRALGDIEKMEGSKADVELIEAVVNVLHPCKQSKEVNTPNIYVLVLDLEVDD